MKSDSEITLDLKTRKLTDLIVRLGVVLFLVVLCFRVFAPFLALLLWALILAIAIYPLHQRLAKRLGNKQGRASIALILGCVLIIGVPASFLVTTLVSDSHTATSSISAQSIEIPVPKDSVKDWPIVGEKVYKAWDEAATNFPEFQKEYGTQLQALSHKIVGAATGAMGAALLFFAAFIIAGIMMAYGEGGTQSMKKIAIRFAGQRKGPELHQLSVGTVRSVAMGVVGVAFFQSLLFGIGFIMAGIPMPGLIALAVLLTGIIQLPAVIFGVPAIAFLWISGDASVGMNVFLTVYFIIASISDNVLKPLMLGRGVKTPLPVVLIGALGGMFTAGFIGLFLGAILLALGYEVFMDWLNDNEEEAADGDTTPETPSIKPVAEGS